MFPIRDHNPAGRLPYVTITLIVLNLLVFAFTLELSNDPRRYSDFLNAYALFPDRVAAGHDQLTLVTSIFLHGGFFHFLGNMLFLWIFGDNLEDSFGHTRFALFYLACGIGAGLIHAFTDPRSDIPTIGASGAIAGILGGYLLLFPRAEVDILLILVVFFRIFTVPAWVMLGLWFALQIFNGTTVDVSGGGVAYWAHAGGFVVGFILTVPYFIRRGGADFWRGTKGHPPHPEARYRLRKSEIPHVKRRR